MLLYIIDLSYNNVIDYSVLALSLSIVFPKIASPTLGRIEACPGNQFRATAAQYEEEEEEELVSSFLFSLDLEPGDDDDDDVSLMIVTLTKSQCLLNHTR